MIEIINTAITDVKIIIPRLFADQRGFFYESYNYTALQQQAGIDQSFVQDNHSKSVAGVLRGLHYQIKNPQGKLVRVVEGEIFDVAVDLRASSPTFKQWVGVYLSAQNRKQLWLPAGFAHGFYTCSETAQVLYKTTDYYAPEYERTIVWNDPALAIKWPNSTAPLLSEKDLQGMLIENAEVYT